MDRRRASKVQNTRADLLGGTASGDLVHVELQSGNDALMPLRTAEYCLGIFASSEDFHGRFCSMSANRRFAWRVNCAARMCCSATARSTFGKSMETASWKATESEIM